MMTLEELIKELQDKRREAGVDIPVRMSVKVEGRWEHHDVHEVVKLEYDENTEIVLTRGGSSCVATELG